MGGINGAIANGYPAYPGSAEAKITGAAIPAATQDPRTGRSSNPAMTEPVNVRGPDGTPVVAYVATKEEQEAVHQMMSAGKAAGGEGRLREGPILITDPKQLGTLLRQSK